MAQNERPTGYPTTLSRNQGVAHRLRVLRSAFIQPVFDPNDRHSQCWRGLSPHGSSRLFRSCGITPSGLRSKLR